MIYFIICLGLLFSTLYNFFHNKNSDRLFYCLAFITLALFAFRSQFVGGDTFLYVSEFVSGNYPERELGWNLFCKIAGFFGNTPLIFISLTSIVSILPFLLLVHKYSHNKTLSLLYIFLFANTALVSLETNLRQNIGTGLFMLAFYIFDEVKDKGWRDLLIPIVLALWGALSHSSLYFVIPLAIVVYFIKISKKVALAAVLITYIVGTISSQYASSILEHFFNYADGYEALVRLTQYGKGGDLGNFSNGGLSLGSLLVVFWSTSLIYLCQKEEINNYFIKMLVLYTCIWGVFRSFDMMFRLVFTYQLFSFVYIPKAFNRLNKYSILIILLLLIWSRALFQLCTTPSMQNPDSKMFPYTTMFDFL